MTAGGTGGNSYTWNAEGRLIQVSNGVSGTTACIYDGDGKRVKRCTGTTPPGTCATNPTGMLYWYSPGGSILTETDLSGTVLYDYIYFAGRRIGRGDTQTGAVWLYYPDVVGSTRTITGAYGVVCFDADYYPFGSQRTYVNTCPQSYNFTGMQTDSESGDDHTWFRQYSPLEARWLTPDPLAGDIANPQSLNRYAYALNNPTSFIDPLGLDPRDRGCYWVEDETSGHWVCPPGVDPGDPGQGSTCTKPGRSGGGCGAGGGGGGIAELPPRDFGNIISAFFPNPCGTTGFGGGIGMAFGGSADASTLAFGITSTASAGGGIFYDSKTGKSGGGFVEGGAAAWAGPSYTGIPQQAGQPLALGAYAGLGLTVFVTNARSVRQLAGPFTTLSLNVGAGPLKFSAQLSFSGSIWQVSLGPPVPYVSFATTSASLSKVTTATFTTDTGCGP